MSSGEIALFVLGWLVLLSLPVMGFVLRQRQGFWIGGIGAVFAILCSAVMLDPFRLDNLAAAGFFAGICAATVLHPVSLWERVQSFQGLLSGLGIVLSVALQILTKNLWGEKGMIVVLGSEFTLIALWGATYAYRTRSGGDFGFGGWEEATLSIGAILVLTISALLILTFVRPPGIQSSVGRA